MVAPAGFKGPTPMDFANTAAKRALWKRPDGCDRVLPELEPEPPQAVIAEGRVSTDAPAIEETKAEGDPSMPTKTEVVQPLAEDADEPVLLVADKVVVGPPEEVPIADDAQSVEESPDRPGSGLPTG